MTFQVRGVFRIFRVAVCDLLGFLFDHVLKLYYAFTKLRNWR